MSSHWTNMYAQLGGREINLPFPQVTPKGLWPLHPNVHSTWIRGGWEAHPPPPPPPRVTCLTHCGTASPGHHPGVHILSQDGVEHTSSTLFLLVRRGRKGRLGISWGTREWEGGWLRACLREGSWDGPSCGPSLQAISTCSTGSLILKTQVKDKIKNFKTTPLTPSTRPSWAWGSVTALVASLGSRPRVEAFSSRLWRAWSSCYLSPLPVLSFSCFSLWFSMFCASF